MQFQGIIFLRDHINIISSAPLRRLLKGKVTDQEVIIYWKYAVPLIIDHGGQISPLVSVICCVNDIERFDVL